MKKRSIVALSAAAGVLALAAALFFGVRAAFPRPYRTLAENSGLPSSLVYAVMKTESGFREDAESRAGAVGIMQLLPSTARFVCRLEGMDFSPERLKEGDYNVTLGCAYLRYLLGRFGGTAEALCAYNAGEGKTAEWLKNENYSDDGVRLRMVPYPETASYIKKVEKYRKIYEFFYD